MTNTYPTVPQWTAIAIANYPVAARRDADPHTDGDSRIASIVGQVAGITRGSALKSTAKIVAAGKCDQTATFTLDGMAALASYAVKPGKSVESRVGSFVSGRTGWHGPINGLVIPAIDAGVLVIDGLIVGHNTSTGKPVGTGKPPATPNNIHNPRILVARGSETVKIAALPNIVAGALKTSTVAVTAYIASTA